MRRKELREDLKCFKWEKKYFECFFLSYLIHKHVTHEKNIDKRIAWGFFLNHSLVFVGVGSECVSQKSCAMLKWEECEWPKKLENFLWSWNESWWVINVIVFVIFLLDFEKWIILRNRESCRLCRSWGNT